MTAANDYRNGHLKTKIAVKAGVKTVVTFTNEGSYETAVESMYLDMIHRGKSPFYVKVAFAKSCRISCTAKFEKPRAAGGTTTSASRVCRSSTPTPSRITRCSCRLSSLI